MTTTRPAGSALLQVERAAIIDQIPAWATEVTLDEDGYVHYKSVASKGLEVCQSSHLVVNQIAGTVSYEPIAGLQVWVPHIDACLTPNIARAILADLREVLALVDEIEAAQA